MDYTLLKIKAHYCFMKNLSMNLSIVETVIYGGKRFFRLLNKQTNKKVLFKKCSLENPKMFFYGIAAKTPFWNLYF